jgi:hypothetical protein
MDPFFLSKMLTKRLNIYTMENNETPKQDDQEVLSPVVAKKEAVKKAAKKVAKEEPKKEKVKDAKAAEAERIRLRNLGYI